MMVLMVRVVLFCLLVIFTIGDTLISSYILTLCGKHTFHQTLRPATALLGGGEVKEYIIEYIRTFIAGDEYLL